MENKVSIVVPVYNGERYADKCIKNLLAQSYKDIEIILMDDGSSDNTPQILDAWAEKDERIVVVHQKNSGVSVARNNGTDRATGDYILYMDIDDDITENLIEDNIRLAREKDADILMFGFWYLSEDTGKRSDNKIDVGFSGDAESFFNDYLIKTIDSEMLNAPWNKLYKISFLKENNLKFLPKYPIYEDIYFNVNALKYAKNIVVNNELYYVYYVRRSGSAITRYVDDYFKIVSKFYESALEYSAMFRDNTRQIEAFSGFYVGLVTNNLKQISCNDDIKFKEKRRLIKDICCDDRFRKALRTAKLEPKKSFVKTFALCKLPLCIIMMYRIRGMQE